ncbi:NACHT, LRR and PYD domains-containing protein 1b allele 5-like [Clinocottus analis]|uniref:NACHT, LRR and PYD domains-containing protein 1b allele 5-like n=1 Tax=Clinocottus analis TaxID=304258 RepID=UPI0035C12C9E
MESIRSQQYMPAGPLMNITVIAGKLDEVHLPHWICIDDNPTILDKFAVLHIDDCGVVVEKVSEVTSSHVKLCEPVFSPRAVLMRVGFPVKINCNVLIYKTNTAFLTLHVYLIPNDPGLQQEMDKREMSYGYKVIRKPHPERSLKIHDRFVLAADLEGAEINPKDLKLRCKSRTLNFFEVYTRNPDRDFALKLNQEKERQQVWTCTIRKDEYQNTGLDQETDVTRYYPKTAKKAITDTLANLSKKKFDSFCEELLDRRAEPQVKRNMVEGKDYLDVGNVLVDIFTEAKAPAVVVELLREIGCSNDADKLGCALAVLPLIGCISSTLVHRDRLELKRPVHNPIKPGSSDNDNQITGHKQGEHFVDKHQCDLIERVNNIKPILDNLLAEGVIPQEDYDNSEEDEKTP